MIGVESGNPGLAIDLNQILKPFVSYWMGIFGVRPNSPINKYCRLAWSIQRWVWFSITIALGLYTLLYSNWNSDEITNSYKLGGNKSVKTFTWNVHIDYANTAIHTIAVHFCLLFVVSRKWNGLKEDLENILRENYDDNRLQLRGALTIYRKMSIQTIFFMIILVICDHIDKLDSSRHKTILIYSSIIHCRTVRK